MVNHVTDGRNRPQDEQGPEPDVTEFLMSDERRRNAVDGAFLDRLNEAITSAEERQHATLVFRSALETVFSSGADLTLPDAERADVSDRLYGTYQRMLRSPVIFVADVARRGRGRGRPTVPRRRCLHGHTRCLVPLRRRRPRVGRERLGAGERRRAPRRRRHVPDDAQGGRRRSHQVGDRDTPGGMNSLAEIARSDPAARQRLKQLLTAELHEPLARERTGNRDNWTGSIEGLRR